MTSPDLLLMLLADARLPAAGHTQSGGLEPGLRHGLDARDVPAYLQTRLDTVARVEAGTAVVALHHLRQRLPLSPVEEAWAARTPSPAMRATSRTMGRALLRLAARLWPESPDVRRVGVKQGAPRAVVLAGVASAAGLSPGELARLIGYDDVQTVAAAALKLVPLDPAAVTGWVLAALSGVDELAASVAHLVEPDTIPATGAPQIEWWAETHARTSRRLFSA